MSFFSKLTPAHRIGEKNFERARAAELRRDFDAARNYFTRAAAGFDEHFALKSEARQEVRPSHQAMAGICYARLGRNEDALKTLDACLGQKDIPDAYLHAGYAAAKLGQTDRAVEYWKRYPDWADQRIIADVLKKQIAAIRDAQTPDLQDACEAVAEAVFRQDKENAKAKLSARGKKKVPPKRGY